MLFKFDALGRWLHAKVTLVVLILFLASVWSLAFYTNRVLRNDMQAMFGEQQATTVAMLTAGINSEVKDRTAALELVASAIDDTLINQPAALHELIEKRRYFLTLFNAGILVTRLDGTAVAEMPKIGRVGLNYLDRDHVAAALQEGKATIGKPIIGKQVTACLNRWPSA